MWIVINDNDYDDLWDDLWIIVMSYMWATFELLCMGSMCNWFEKDVILELIWCNGSEQCVIHEPIWWQMLTKLYVERYMVIMILRKWWMLHAQWESYELHYSTWICTWWLQTVKGHV